MDEIFAVFLLEFGKWLDEVLPASSHNVVASRCFGW